MAGNSASLDSLVGDLFYLILGDHRAPHGPLSMCLECEARYKVCEEAAGWVTDVSDGDLVDLDVVMLDLALRQRALHEQPERDRP